VDPTRRGPDWMKISPVAASLFHERTHNLGPAFRNTLPPTPAPKPPVVRCKHALHANVEIAPSFGHVERLTAAT
jgi:hypothetical protein